MNLPAPQFQAVQEPDAFLNLFPHRFDFIYAEHPDPGDRPDWKTEDVRYQREKRAHLQTLNSKLDVLRYQTRLLLDFELLSQKRYQHAGQLINGIGIELGGWIKQQGE